MKKIFFLSAFIFAAFASFNTYGQDTTNMTGSPGTGKIASEAMVQEVIDTEKSIIEAVKNKQPDQLSSFLIEDYQGVYGSGIVSKKENVESIRNLDLREVTISEENVVFPSPDVAILTYKATAEGSIQDREFSGTYNISSTYVKREGKWMCAAHSEIKAQQ